MQLDDARMATVLVTSTKQRQRGLFHIRILDLEDAQMFELPHQPSVQREQNGITDLALVDQVLLIGHFHSEDLSIWSRTASNAS